jgi:hypothetical protein
MPVVNAVVIRDLASLRLWRQQLRSTLWARDLPIVQFQIRQVSLQQNDSFSALAGSLQKACGCGISGLFMTAAIVAMVVSFFVSGNHFSSITLLQVLSFVGITVLASLSGKLFGLFWARWRLLRLATSVHDMIVGASQRAVAESFQEEAVPCRASAERPLIGP